MIPISYVFEDQDEKLIEDLTIQCFHKYGDAFLESLIPFFETGVMTEMESYFDKEVNTLFEIDEEEYIKAKVKEDVKESVKRGKKASEALTGKRRGIRKLTHRMSKNKVGRAIIKGIRKVAYGTKLGRKIVRKHADITRKLADVNIKNANTAAKTSIKTGFVAKGLARQGKIADAMRYGMASDKFGREAGIHGHQASKKLRQAHQQDRNAKYIKSRQANKVKMKQGKSKRASKMKSTNIPLLAAR